MNSAYYKGHFRGGDGLLPQNKRMILSLLDALDRGVKLSFGGEAVG
jgi:hypothetical protein